MDTEAHIIQVGRGKFFSAKTNSLFSDANPAPSAKASVPIPLEDTFKALPWVSWGDDNLWPQNLLDQLKTVPSAGRGLLTRIAAHYGKGLYTFRKETTAGNETLIPAMDANQVEFAKRNHLKLFLREYIMHYEFFANPFCELILSKDRKQIVQIYNVDAPYCRWGHLNENTGKIDTCFISGVWERGIPSGDYLEEVPVLDPYDPVTDLQNRSDSYKYILPVFFPYPEKRFYKTAIWHSAYEAGWMKIASQVPAFKQALFKNQISIKYHIQIPTNYWELKFKDKWAAMSPEEQMAERNKTYTDIENYLVGATNAGKSLQTTYYYDADLGKEYPGVKIDVIDDKLKDGAYIPDTQHADSQILLAQGVDPTVMGTVQPGDKSNAGGGSDKREALLLMNAWMQIHRDVTLFPLQVIHEYNGWTEGIEYGFRDMVMTTMDVNPAGVTSANQNSQVVKT